MRSLIVLGVLAVCAVPPVDATNLGIEIEDLSDPRPQMPTSERILQVQGRARCTFDDRTPGTTTHLSFREPTKYGWNLEFTDDSLRLTLDPTRCADPSYFVPFNASVRVSPSLSAAPFEEMRASITVTVVKTPPPPAIGSQGTTAFNLTVVADELVAGEIHAREYAASVWGRVHLDAGRSVVVPILIDNRGTGRARVTVDPPASAMGGLLFQPPGDEILASPFRSGGQQSGTIVHTTVTIPTNMTGAVEFSLTARGHSMFSHVNASFSETIRYTWIVREPSLLPSFPSAQWAAAIVLAFVVYGRRL